MGAASSETRFSRTGDWPIRSTRRSRGKHAANYGLQKIGEGSISLQEEQARVHWTFRRNSAPRSLRPGHRHAVKRYKSEQPQDSSGAWEHEKITLRPVNPEFPPIVLDKTCAADVLVVAESVEALEITSVA